MADEPIHVELNADERDFLLALMDWVRPKLPFLPEAEQIDRVLQSKLKGNAAGSSVNVPSWIFDAPERAEYFLLSIKAGRGEVDGGHDDPAGVARALLLCESIRALAPAPGTRHVMLRVQAVPPFEGTLKQDVIDALNRRLSPPPPERPNG